MITAASCGADVVLSMGYKDCSLNLSANCYWLQDMTELHIVSNFMLPVILL